MNTEDRRAPGTTRAPFDALVEVGGALGPTFEAQAINVSEDGIQLRTAYLPEAGQTLTCRFDAGPAHNVLASGEVVWAQGAENGGEFGVRFTDVDLESIDALKRICGVAGESLPILAGSKVRLHIDGLASPMRAKIRDAHASAVTVGSDLGFLQVGRPLELEDSQSGKKRPAHIDRVDVVVDPASHVPQLVVTLRYSDVQAREVVAANAIAPAEGKPSSPGHEDAPGTDDVADKMKGAFARGAAAIGPACARFAERTKTAAMLLAKRSRAGAEDGATSLRRTTAPPPGGGLHASGRRVVRGDAPTTGHDGAPSDFRLPMSRHRLVWGGAVLVVAIAGALVIKRGRHEATQASAPPVVANVQPAAPPPSPPPPDPAPVPAVSPNAGPATAPSGVSAAIDDNADASKASPKRHARVTPFANGPVSHGNLLHLKMDGPVEAIEGAQQPTGFTVKLPGRKALEPAAPLAARDSRIAAIRVSNDSAGAELTVAFKDGVPNYRVSAKNDMLIVALAAPGAIEPAVTRKDDKTTGRIAKRGTHARAYGPLPSP